LPGVSGAAAAPISTGRAGVRASIAPMRRTASIALLVTAFGLAACGGSQSSGGASAAPPAAPSTASPSQASSTPDTSGLPVVTEVVKNKAYKQTQLSIKADTSYALHFDNRDPGVFHSMDIYDDNDFPLDTSAPVLFSFDPFAGAANMTFVIPPLNKGKYLFQCAVHDRMQGTIYVGIK
jgi:Cupredoxin-like domain